ncbi:hypothetical protein OSG_eHP27_00180 [environmental Halophage eHP-27]|nr:hypothetical protein OSG_eHP27_00180 [environmental Halophage eHP-27]
MGSKTLFGGIDSNGHVTTLSLSETCPKCDGADVYAKVVNEPEEGDPTPAACADCRHSWFTRHGSEVEEL